MSPLKQQLACSRPLVSKTERDDKQWRKCGKKERRSGSGLIMPDSTPSPPPPPPQKNDVYCFWAVMKEKDTNEDGKF